MSVAPPTPFKPRKGKEKATPDFDSDDLNPAITYRILFAQSLGARDPLRVIALCDSDAFYAACEMVRLGITDKPLAVVQWQSLLAINYPSRKFGLTRMMKVQEAKELCPDLVAVHVPTFREGATEPGYWENPDSRTHKVSLDYYRRESGKILELFKEILPENTEIEKASIDEAFFDFTRPVRQILLDRYPYLAHVPEDAPLGINSPLPPPPQVSWDKLSAVLPVDPSQETSSETDIPTTWHDVALSIAAELMTGARQEVSAKLGYTTSAGIARNKFLAKLCASYRKPMGQSILRNAAIPNYLRPMAFQKIRFLGGKLGNALASEYDVSTIADLLSVSLGKSPLYSCANSMFTMDTDEMQNKFGEESIWVYQVLRGIDYSEVKEKQLLNKSMLAAKQLPTPITKATEGYHWIRVLAAELALRLNDARKTTPNMWPKTIALRARMDWGYDTERSKQGPWPFVRDVTVDVVAAAGNKLWKELIGVDDSVPLKITHVSLSFTGIEGVESGLQGIDTFFKSGQKRSLEADPANDQAGTSERSSRNISKDLSSYVCGKCAFKSSLPPSATRSEAERDDALHKIYMEHTDFHLALDLSKVPSKPSPVRAESKPKSVGPKEKKRRKESPKGIEKFFGKS